MIGLGLEIPSVALRSVRDAYAINGISPALVADFKNGVYRKNGAPTTFAELFTATGSGSLGPNGWSMDSATDTLSIAAADLPYSASAMSFAMRGAVTYSDSDLGYEVFFVRWFADGSNYIVTGLGTQSTFEGQLKFGQAETGTADVVVESAPGSLSPGTDVPFSFAARHGATSLNGAVDGLALVENDTPTALPDLSGTDLYLGYQGVFTFERFIMFGENISDAGLAAASS